METSGDVLLVKVAIAGYTSHVNVDLRHLCDYKRALVNTFG